MLTFQNECIGALKAMRCDLSHYEHLYRRGCDAAMEIKKPSTSHITSGLQSGTVTEGECSDSTGADSAPAAKAGDDDDGGDGDGEPAPRPPHRPKPSRRVAAPLKGQTDPEPAGLAGVMELSLQWRPNQEKPCSTQFTPSMQITANATSAHQIADHPAINRPRKAQNTAPLPRATAQPTVNLATPPAPAALWKLPEVLRHFPVSRATWYAGIKDGRFPQPIKLGPRAVAWRSADILALTV